MHIDFTPPSNGTYNNAGSSRQLANYLEHEDLERIEKGIYTEGFFNLTDDNIYKSKVIKDIVAKEERKKHVYSLVLVTILIKFYCKYKT